MKQTLQKHMKKAGLLFLPLFLTCILQIFSFNQNFVDWYAHYIFPIFPNTIGRLLSPIPFSVYEFLIYALIFYGAYLLIRLIFFLVTKPARYKERIQNFLYWLCFFIFYGTLLLHATTLIQYNRSPIASALNLIVQDSSTEELKSLCTELGERLSALSREITIDDIGLLKLPDTYAEDAKEAMEQLGQKYTVFSGYYPNPKPVTWSSGMSYLNLTGMYSPFTIEANYNNHIPSYNIPYTICHELAHLKGFIREDEAGFIAYLACSSSRDPILQYSGCLSGFIYATNALYSAGATDEYQQIFASLSEQVLRDVRNNSAYWKQFDGSLAKTSEKANDLYLKANKQTDGTKSYGRMVDLMLALYRT